jgi:hypothetical protein
MKEMHFSQQITNIGTSHFVSDHRQRVWHRMVDFLYRLDEQGGWCYTSMEHPLVNGDWFSEEGMKVEINGSKGLVLSFLLQFMKP